jgi:hypothetical protein
MAVTFHVYTENALRYIAQNGIWPATMLTVFCSTDSSVFNATFTRPLRQTTTAAGVTTQTGLLDSGVVAVGYGIFKTEARVLNSPPSNPFDFTTIYAYSTQGSKFARLGNDLNTFGVGASVPFRSALICIQATANPSLSELEQSYALCMVDFGELVPVGPNGFTVIDWNTLMEITLA